MEWSIGEAKQQFSEVVRLCAQEPQAIYKHDKPVAALISAADYQEFQHWRAMQSIAPLSRQFDELRASLLAAGSDGLDVPERRALERPNAFLAAPEAPLEPRR